MIRPTPMQHQAAPRAPRALHAPRVPHAPRASRGPRALGAIRALGATTAATAAFAFALLAGPLASVPAHAHEAHGKPAYGGVVAEGGTFQAELVSAPAALTLYVSDHGTPVATAGARAKLTLLSGAQKTEVTLAPAGSNRLSAASGPLAAGTKVIANVTLADGRSAALRFEIK